MKIIYTKVILGSKKVLGHKQFWSGILVLVMNISLMGCEDFVQIDPPDTEISGEVVFAGDETALSVLNAVYHRLQNSGFSSGNTSSLTVLCELSSDILKDYSTSVSRIQFYENSLTLDNSLNLSLWSSLYQRIYEVNAILEGAENSRTLSESVRQQLQGETKFIRAFSYFYLTNLYGRVPLITSTDYPSNAVMPQSEVSEIYDQILTDLLDSESLLDNNYHGDLRTRVNKGTVWAMLARVYLYLENWEQAERYATLVIDSPLYSLLPDLNSVFLKESTETIWHLLPVDSRYNTWEGYYLILLDSPESPRTQFSMSLSTPFMEDIENPDLRKEYWTEELETESESYYYPYKYKIKVDGSPLEYSVVFRLSEQFLIRAEARAQMGGNITGAIEDLDAIRGRANLPLISAINPSISVNDLLNVIWHERKVEFFAEWGHRWFDLKRTGIIDSVLSGVKPSWQPYKALFPIPEHELLNNPLLEPNIGY